MKRKIFSILFATVLALSLCLVPAVAGATTYNRTLELENKDYTTWAIKSDSISGTLNYNSSGPTFDFSFTAQGLTAGDYSLIYYADQEDRFNYWGGDNPGAVIATFTASSTITSGDMSVDLGMNLPCPPDANMYDHDYTTAPDNYANAHGAKIWLVPTSALTSGTNLPVTAWPPNDDWLFETELIWYTDTDTGSAVGLEGDVLTITAISVSPTSIDFGTIRPGDVKPGPTIIVSNVGTLTVVVDATVAPVTGVFKYLKLNGGYSPSYLGFWDNIISSLSPNSGQGVGTLLDVPSNWSAYGPETATLTFTATAS